MDIQKDLAQGRQNSEPGCLLKGGKRSRGLVPHRRLLLGASRWQPPTTHISKASLGLCFCFFFFFQRSQKTSPAGRKLCRVSFSSQWPLSTWLSNTAFSWHLIVGIPCNMLWCSCVCVCKYTGIILTQNQDARKLYKIIYEAVTCTRICMVF